MANWKVYATRYGRDSELVYDGPSKSFKAAILRSRGFNYHTYDKLEFGRKTFTYYFDGITYSTKPIFYLVIKAGVYEGQHPFFLNCPATFTVNTDLPCWSGHAKNLKEAIELAKSRETNHTKYRSLANAAAVTIEAVDHKTYLPLYYNNISNDYTFCRCDN